MRYFFLSYARGDDNEYVQRFYRDLSREVRVRKGLRQGEPVGFIDVNSIQLGTRWSDELLSALSECSIFLPLYSPGYFRSEYCGKEWAAFECRRRQHFERTGNVAENVIPVVWFHPPRLPEVAQAIHYNTVTLGTTYAEWGLRQLIRLHRFQDEYEETVTALADQIVVLSERTQLVSSQLNLAFDELGNPFQDLVRTDSDQAGSGFGGVPPRFRHSAAPVPDPRPAERAGGGPGSRHVSFVIASAGSEEVRTVRSTLDCYGPSAQHWMPYQPALAQPLGSYAREIAGRRQFGSELADLDGLDARIDEAHRENRIVVLLVDPWAARLAGYSAQLEAYDRRNEPTVPVLIAMSDQDDETCRCRDVLNETVHQVFPNNVLRQDSIFRPMVNSAEQFASDLEFVLQETVNRLLRRGPVRRAPMIEVVPARPVLDGPSTS